MHRDISISIMKCPLYKNMGLEISISRWIGYYRPICLLAQGVWPFA